MSIEQLAILASLFFSLSANTLFFSSALAGRPPGSPHTWLFAISIFVAITALHAAGLFVVLNRWTAKPLLAILLVVTALAAYYMSKYTVFFNTEMVRNVLKTDVKEASELLSPGMLLHLLLFAVLPVIVVWRLPLRYRPWRRALMVRIAYIVGALLLAAGAIMLVFQDFSSLMRNQKEVRFLITPSNYLVSAAKVLSADTSESGPRIPISADAKLQQSWAKRSKPMLFVLVVGETTRAANWGLNGYAHQTTPELAQLDILN
ncbi:MAG TPA: phosphoethanolamine transferase domain-containing protein, partial [Oxalicibacterium sp.]|nr:phosphoethanolamine transferase domain-containing protein [Oxalicibacterium sp.]